MRSDGVVIVGGGLAAQRCARRSGGRLRGGDPHRLRGARAPYDRPPLSKEVLAGAVAEDSVAFRPAGWYVEHDVELLLGRRAASARPRRETARARRRDRSRPTRTC